MSKKKDTLRRLLSYITFGQYKRIHTPSPQTEIPQPILVRIKKRRRISRNKAAKLWRQAAQSGKTEIDSQDLLDLLDLLVAYETKQAAHNDRSVCEAFIALYFSGEINALNNTPPSSTRQIASQYELQQMDELARKTTIDDSRR